jgi:hypothetical protein
MVNPLQCFHLNSSPPSDLVLSTNNRKVGPKEGYTEWLKKLRKTCTDNDVLLIFDEVCAAARHAVPRRVCVPRSAAVASLCRRVPMLCQSTLCRRSAGPAPAL